MFKQVVWLDADGVLLDYINPFIQFAPLNISYKDLPTYNFLSYFETPEHGVKRMQEFCESEEFADLKPIADPLLLAALKNAGYELRVITQLVGAPFARVNRIKNLTRVFGSVFSEFVFTNAGECKLDILTSRWQHENNNRTRSPLYDNHGVDYILVEDNPKLLLKAEQGSYPIETHGIHHPYNADDLKNVRSIRVRQNFDQVAEDLLERKV